MRDDFKSEKGTGGGGGGRGMPSTSTVAAGVEVNDGGWCSFSERNTLRRKQSMHKGFLNQDVYL